MYVLGWQKFIFEIISQIWLKMIAPEREILHEMFNMM